MFLGTSCAGTYRMYRYRMLASSIMQWTVLSMSHWPFCSCSCSRAIIFKTRKKVPAKIIHEWPILCFCAIFSNCQKNTHRSSTNYDVETGNRRSLTVVRFTRSVYQLYLTLIDIFRKIMRLCARKHKWITITNVNRRNHPYSARWSKPQPVQRSMRPFTLFATLPLIKGKVV